MKKPRAPTKPRDPVIALAQRTAAKELSLWDAHMPELMGEYVGRRVVAELRRKGYLPRFKTRKTTTLGMRLHS